MRADLPDIGNPDQDPMSEVGYPTGVVGFHGLFGCKPLGEPSDVRQLICASAWSFKFPNFSRRFRVRVHTWLVHSSLHSNDLQTTEKSHDFNRVSP